MYRGFIAGVFVVGAVLIVGPLAAGRQLLAAEGTYKAEVLGEGVPAAVAGPVRGLMEAKAVRVSGGGGKVVADIWLRKEVAAAENFAASQAIKYPIVAGSLVGVLRLPEGGGSDFRGQKLKAGVYTLRYMLQPEDGNHLGTAPQRDFLVLSPASQDTKADALDYDTLAQTSMKATGTAHPGIMSMVPVESPPQTTPALEHVEQGNLWVLAVKVKTKAGEKAGELPLRLVVVGKAAE